MNKDKAKNHSFYKKPMICDQLDDNSKQRLELLMEGIDEVVEKTVGEEAINAE